MNYKKIQLQPKIKKKERGTNNNINITKEKWKGKEQLVGKNKSKKEKQKNKSKDGKYPTQHQQGKQITRENIMQSYQFPPTSKLVCALFFQKYILMG